MFWYQYACSIIFLIIGKSTFCCITSANSTSVIKSFSSWKFSNSLLQILPVEDEKKNFVREVKNAIFSEVSPTPLKLNPKLVLLSRSALENCLEIAFKDIFSTAAFRDFACGNILLNKSICHRYGGHQFGSWSSQLGDGRAHLLGEYVNTKGERWELQLKGSGKTPYSRYGDGRAVLRSSLREFLCSEAMFALGVPTSRAVSLVVSDDPVIRDPLYNGTVVKEKAAVVLRLAPSWFRFGSFEILAANNELELLAQLLDFVIENHFKDIVSATSPNRYVNFFATVVNQTTEMIAKWLSYGFAHGICNTDNFSILSITIDYGPFGFVDSFDLSFVPNMSDDSGMYALNNQQTVALTNLRRLYDALKLIFTANQRTAAEKILASFKNIFESTITKEFRKKLGLSANDQDDLMLISSFLIMMHEVKADFTITFRQLSSLSLSDISASIIPRHMWALNDLKRHKQFQHWLKLYHDRLLKNSFKNDHARLKYMRSVNPRYVLRNWMAEEAIKKAEGGDYSNAWKIHMILQHPFEEQSLAEISGYASRPPKWAKSLRVSCSS